MKYAVLIALAVAACGPSGKEIRTAKTAVYLANIDKVLDVALQVTQQTYKIDGVDAEHHRFKTEPQIYSETGGRESADHEGYVATRKGGSVQVYFVVEAKWIGDRPSEDRVVITITPKTYQMLAWSPKPRELLPDDPNLPPWVSGRVDSLALAIYQRLHLWTVKR